MYVLYQPLPHEAAHATPIKMDLTPVSELSSTAEYDEECDLLGIPKTDRKKKDEPKKNKDHQEDGDLHQIKKQLETENEELRSMCGYLGEAYDESKQLALEWQCFGSYTADILKDEIASSEVKDKITREELQKLSKENKELKEMCLFLDQSRDEGSKDNSMTPPEAMELMLHARVVGEINKKQKVMSQYSGLTRSSTLKDSQAIRKGFISETNKEMALEEMKKRLDRLEAERLELIKSLSAAHILAANTNGAGGRDVTLPPNLQNQLNAFKKSSLREGDGVHRSKAVSSLSGSGHGSGVSPYIIMNAVTLLDVVRRVDAATASGFPDGVAEGEAVALRLLVNIAWQKIQEKLKKQTNK